MPQRVAARRERRISTTLWVPAVESPSALIQTRDERNSRGGTAATGVQMSVLIAVISILHSPYGHWVDKGLVWREAYFMK